MICQQCRTELPEGAKFCLECGAPVPQLPDVLVCQQCQTELPDGARFCTECGTPVPEPQAPSVTFEPVGDPQVYFQLGYVAYGNQEYQESIEHYDKAIELDPNDGRYNNRGNSYRDLGQHQRAIEDYDKAIDLDPNDAAAYYNRGNAYKELGQASKAQQDWDKARSLGYE